MTYRANDAANTPVDNLFFVAFSISVAPEGVPYIIVELLSDRFVIFWSHNVIICQWTPERIREAFILFARV
ncbi:hypothetical protein Pan258_10030 [Symmachiella dynata]|nr:hypothetical protein Pan258_10030 [Symmachiella dynata]